MINENWIQKKNMVQKILCFLSPCGDGATAPNLGSWVGFMFGLAFRGWVGWVGIGLVGFDFEFETFASLVLLMKVSSTKKSRIDFRDKGCEKDPSVVLWPTLQ